MLGTHPEYREDDIIPDTKATTAGRVSVLQVYLLQEHEGHIHIHVTVAHVHVLTQLTPADHCTQGSH